MPPRRALSRPEEDEEPMTLDDAASTVLAIVKPVSLCMSLVIAVISTIGERNKSGFNNMMVYDESENEDDTDEQKFGGALLNAGAFLLLILFMTFILVLLYKYRCTKFIYGWMIFAVTFLLFGFGGQLWTTLFDVYGIPLDAITYYLVSFNVSVTAGITVFGYAPKRFVQGVLIFASVLMVQFKIFIYCYLFRRINLHCYPTGRHG